MECEFCKREFSTKPNLSAHQKSAKYCLDIQGKNNDSFKCECNKIFTCQQRLDEHQNKSCKIKYKINYEQKLSEKDKQCEQKLSEKDKQCEQKLSEKDKQIAEKDKQIAEKDKQCEQKIAEKNEYILKLEEKIEKYENKFLSLASEPKTKNMVVINNMLNLAKENVTKLLDEHMTKDVVSGGQKGLAHMVYEKMLKGPDGKLTYKCVDPSRHNFEFLNSDGIIEKDIKAMKLKNALILSDIIKKASETGNKLWTKADGSIDSDQYTVSFEKVMEIICFDREYSKFRSELSALTF